jgi:anti-sigma-K factor RskA
MSTKAGTISGSARPAGFTLWAAAVTILAAVALVMSAAALTVAARDRAIPGVARGDIHEATSIPLWDEAKLDAMEGRMLAETVRIYGSIPLWDEAKLDAMESRMLAEAARFDG